MSRKRSKGTGWLTAKTAIAIAGAHLGEPTKISVGWVKKSDMARTRPKHLAIAFAVYCAGSKTELSALASE